MTDLTSVLREEATRLDSAAATMRRLADALADRDLRPEPLATPAEMAAGGWTRIPGRGHWQKIAAISYCAEHGGPGDCARIDYTQPWDHDPDHVDRSTTLPYLTDAEFDADCDREQGAA